MLSPDGACKSFDASANGYARAEGVACVILKRSDVQDVPWIVPHDPYCTIMAIGTNNDGYTPQGITFPSGESQYELGMQVSTMSSPPKCYAARLTQLIACHVPQCGLSNLWCNAGLQRC